MLGIKLVEAQRFRGPWQVVQGCIALAKSDRISKAVQNWKKLAKPPDPRVIQMFRRSPSLAPKPLKCASVWAIGSAPLIPAGVFNLKQVAAFDTAKIWPSLISANAGTAAETTQLMQVIAHPKC